MKNGLGKALNPCRDATFVLDEIPHKKEYSPAQRRWIFFRGEKEISVGEWNRLVNERFPMSLKKAHPNPLVRWIEQSRFQTIRRLTGSWKKGLWIDVGAEEGWIIEFLSRWGNMKFVGLEVDRELSSRMKKRTSSRRILGTRGLAENLPFKNNTFDGVMCTEVLEHLLLPERTLDELFRIVRPGGSVVLGVPNEHWILRLKTLLISLGLRKVIGNLSEGSPMGHLWLYDPTSLKRLLRHRGKIEALWYDFPFRFNLYTKCVK